MNKMRCNRGHYYDGDKYASCPHCSDISDQWMNGNSDNNGSYWNGDDSTQTVPVNEYGMNRNIPEWNGPIGTGNETVSINDGDGPTMGFYDQPGGWKEPSGAGINFSSINDGDGPTMGFYPPLDPPLSSPQEAGWPGSTGNNPWESNNGNGAGQGYPPVLSPVAGWLICIEGENRGRDYRINAGNNTIGRSTSNSIALIGDKKVSREQHAIIVYDPRSNAFFAMPGKARGLSYVNGKVILEVTEVKKNDVLELGDSKLMLIPCCDEKFNWNTVYDK